MCQMSGNDVFILEIISVLIHILFVVDIVFSKNSVCTYSVVLLQIILFLLSVILNLRSSAT